MSTNWFQMSTNWFQMSTKRSLGFIHSLFHEPFENIVPLKILWKYHLFLYL
uniref:ORF50e n=1 Tax=Pinus koraiensis TaxID=88728 RepID=A4QM22_PINKO|nr:ORF50e [Pinus koraiensis]ABP35349.1 ORF50e [Pinus koraiensis]